MNSRYHDIPTFRRQMFITISSLVAYIAFLFIAKFTFSDVSEEMRRFWGQAGLVLVFVGALLAGLPFFWNAKTKENIAKAEADISRTNATIELLSKIEKDIGGNFAAHSEHVMSERNAAEEVLRNTRNFPTANDKLGAVSLVLIGIGTLCQIVSLG